MMAAFTALNIEYENTADVPEVDDTKELQVEEALKLYQTALKFHSEGPDSYDEAAKAYVELFKSEIFQYAESQSALNRTELFGPAIGWEELDFANTSPAQLVSTEESSPNTLPQILHLSYKNHGMFLLDKMQHDLLQETTLGEENRAKAIAAAKTALSLFAEALDKDESDLDLWGSAASIASIIGSDRIARYCLEAVLDDEDEGFKAVLSLPGLEEGFAIHQLRKEVQQYHDDLALLLSPLSRLQKRHLSDALLKRLNPYKKIQMADSHKLPPEHGSTQETLLPMVLRLTARTWSVVGDALLRHFQSEQKGLVDPSFSRAISFDVPAGEISESPELRPESRNQSREDEQASTQLHIEASRGSGPNEPANETSADSEAVEESASPAKQEVSVASPSGPNPQVGGDANTDISDKTSRKRNSESAGLPDNDEEGGRMRSKRIKARESIAERTKIQDISNPEQQAEELLLPFTQADEALSAVLVELYERAGITETTNLNTTRKPAEESISLSPTTGEEHDISQAVQDMHDIAASCEPDKARIFLDSETTDRLLKNAQDSGLNAFLGQSKRTDPGAQAMKRFPATAGLGDWLSAANEGSKSTPELAKSWVQNLLKPRVAAESTALQPSSYRLHLWPEDLKRIMVQVIVHLDEYLYLDCLALVAEMDDSALKVRCKGERYLLSAEEEALIEMIQTLYELHLDVYSLIKQPSSGIDETTKSGQNDRLERWSNLTQDALQLRQQATSEDLHDDVSIRNLWATTFHLAVRDDVSQDHLLLCMHQLKAILQVADGPLIELPNNAIMPELSVAAIDAELNRLQIKDFLVKIFDSDEADAVTTIETLEPILELPFVEQSKKFTLKVDDEEIGDGPSSDNDDAPHNASDAASPLVAVSKFLEGASVWSRLHLRKRLRDAYEQIDMKEKVVFCNFRSIEIVARELSSAAFNNAPKDQRQVKLLSFLKLIDDYLVKGLAKIRAVQGRALHLECLPSAQLRSTLAASTVAFRLLLTFLQHEDNVQVGNVTVPTSEGRQKSPFQTLAARVHDMWLRLFMLQYQLLRELMTRRPEDFPLVPEERYRLLCAMHQCVATRSFCRATNNAFLRMCKAEFVSLYDEGCSTKVIDFSWQFCTVLYDLYGIDCCNSATENLEDHAQAGGEEVLTKATSASILDFVMRQATAISMKDLLKLNLEETIEKLYGILFRPRSSDTAIENRRRISVFIKSAIHPLELYHCLQGLPAMTTEPVPEEDTRVASKGLHFLAGNMALNKFLAQKQKSPQAPPVDDLKTACAIYTQSLEYNSGHWETWYRLAQCFDYQLDESVLWTAEKINSEEPIISLYQRSAIHCYVMAVAHASNIEDPEADTISNIAKLYADFGTRMYASSRQPFAMAAFDLRDGDMRFLSKLEIQQTPIKTPAYTPLTEYATWKFAAALFRRSIGRSPNSWWSHFMLGKCLWKMYTASEGSRNKFRMPDKPNARPTMHEVIVAFVQAIEALPQKREAKKEPILEPPYKLLSIVSKLVQRKDLEFAEGAEVLQASDVLRKVGKVTDAEGWEGYIIALLRALKAVDKSGWHHRVTARAAHIIYDETNLAGNDRKLGAMGAKVELTQSIFTKTMSVQVWKPEHERPGRHFTYMTRYTRFFANILAELDDVESLETLTRRIRKKSAEFYEHQKLWHELCLAYLKVLRRYGQIPEGNEDIVFKNINHEEFLQRATRLETWAQNATTEDPLYKVMCMAIELKRLNSTLMKPTLIDDLVCDTYAALYDHARISNPVASEPPAGGVPSADAQTGTTTQPVPVRPRGKGVGRRELQQRAELLTTQASRTAAQAAQSARPSETQTVSVVINSSLPRVTAQSSAAGTPYDGADDDSGSSLSELDDDMPDPGLESERPMFPNLRRKSPEADTATASGVGTPADGTDNEKAEKAADVEAAEHEESSQGDGSKDVGQDESMAEGPDEVQEDSSKVDVEMKDD